MTFEIATRWGDIDHNGHINNVAMATIFEESRSAFFRALPGTWPPFGLRPMVVAVHLDYLAEAFYPDPVRMNIGVLEIGRSSWSLAGLARQKNVACALCLATIACTEGGRPASIPDVLRETLKRVSLQQRAAFGGADAAYP
jgi:acyl-CoA thioester hydrolase